MIEADLLDRADAAKTTPTQLRLVTASGDVMLQLDADRAPHSVAAFLQQVDIGAYDGGAFIRLLRRDNDHGSPRIEVVQGSCPAERFATADFPHESTDLTGLRHQHGTLSLPRKDNGPVSACGFFICIGDQPALDAGGGRIDDGLGFAAFGRVVEGMDIVEAIHRGETLAEAPVDYLRGQLAADPVTIYGIAREASAPSEQLGRLAGDYWRFRVREFPTEASAAGVSGHNHRLEGATDADHARRALLARAMAKRADAIDTAALSPEDTKSLALLRGQLATIIEAKAFDQHRRSRMFPFGSADVPDFLAQTLSVLREGWSAGYRLPRILVPRLLALLDCRRKR